MGRISASMILGLILCIVIAGSAWAESTANTKAAVSVSPGPAGPYEQETIHRSGAGGSSSAPGKGVSGNSFNSWDVRKVTISLAGVIVLIFAMWALGRKMAPGATGARSSSAVQVLVRSPVTPRQQLLLVQIGRRLVLVGSGGAEMNPLCQIDQPDEVAEVLAQVRADKSAVAKNFRSLFGKAEKAYEATEEEPLEPEAEVERMPAGPAPEGLAGLTDRVRRISEKFQ